MRQNYFSRTNISLREKIISLDFQLIFLILILGIISFFAMYSTEQGNIGYYTKSHIFRFSFCFLIFIFFSFLDITFWYRTSYIFYILVLLLLLSVDFFGISSSGSKRWINLFIFNLQPSEIMKVSLIIFLSRYYYKIPYSNVSNIKHIFTPFIALMIPVFLIIKQPAFS